jgi:hypothetical protein
MDGAIWLKKLALHHVRHAVHDTLKASHDARARLRRWRRRTVYTLLVGMHRVVDTAGRRSRSVGRRLRYHAAVLTHRVGLRGRNETPQG